MLKCANKCNLEHKTKKQNEPKVETKVFQPKTVGSAFLQRMSENSINLEKNYLCRGSARAIEMKLQADS